MFFDDVRVPKANRIGPENQGWTVAKYLLQFERFSMASVELRRLLARVSRLAEQTNGEGRALRDEPEFQKKLTLLEVDCQAMEMSEQRVLAELNAGNSPGSISSLLNVVSSERLQHADELGIEVAAYYGLAHQLPALDVGGPSPIGPEGTLPLMPSYLNNRMRTIAGGSAEVQRNIVAKAILGL